MQGVAHLGSMLRPTSLRRGLSTAAATSAANPLRAKPKTAIVLMNLGGPSTLDEVEPFLSRLFHDRDLMKLPVQSMLAPWIAKRRTPKIQKQYGEIGGGSPILRWTNRQGLGLTRVLDEISPKTGPHKHYVAFRYAAPLTEDCISEMKRDGVSRAVAFTQYPQYSCSTTGSSLNELYRKLKLLDPEQTIRWSIIDRWPTHAGLVSAFAQRIQEALLDYPSTERDDVILLFSAHSLPMSVVGRGDHYVREVGATVHAVMHQLGNRNPYYLSWQSKVGPMPWMTPQTADLVKAMGRKQRKNVILVPIAFTSDHIETLYELDLELIREGQEQLGMTGLKRIESLNDMDTFLHAMADIVKEHLLDGKHWSQQYQLTCPSCDKESCRDAKAHFSQFRKPISLI